MVVCRGRPRTRKGPDVSLLIWIILATLYLVLLWTLGITTWRNGHRVLFFVGIFLPILWVIGAVMAPTPTAATSGAAGGPQ
jgi:hypothetical protein